MEIKVYNLTGEVVDQVEFATDGLEPVNKKLLYYVVNAYLANQRQGNASSKTKAEVAGGGRKPWKQKGTGRARVGSIRSPLWRGGGVIFGPKPRSYFVALPAKVRQSALSEALKEKILGSKISLLAEYQIPEAKTKSVSRFLQKIGLSGKIITFVPQDAELFRRAGRNIPGIRFGDWKSPDFFHILNADNLLVYREIWDKLKEKIKG
ncbi:MAG: 50S ribosomal protein L4 [Candidatus Omnitrophota bacterium]